MKANDKIYVSKYLRHLNEDAKSLGRKINQEYIKCITCKELAELCEVTPATISNLNTNSSFFLIHKIASEILDCYYGYFMYIQDQERKEYPDELIYPKDINYVIYCLTSYWTDEWLNY